MTTTVDAGMSAAPATGDAVTVTGVGKRFPGVIANHDVSFAVPAGTIHALVGENGAGKSTLMKILYGVQKPDEGTIAVNGVVHTFNSPSDAIASGHDDRLCSQGMRRVRITWMMSVCVSRLSTNQPV